MELKNLEAMRIRKIFKLCSLLIFNTAAFIATLYYFLTLENADTVVFKIGFSIIICLIFYVYGGIMYIPKNFEKHAKKKLLPNILKNIINKDGEIYWQGEEFETKEASFEEKIIANLEIAIQKQCTCPSSSDEDSDKYFEYLKEQETLEEKETRTEKEELRLKEINSFIEEQDKKAMAAEEEKYNIRMQLLKKIENKNALAQYSKEDLVKIQYLKKENQIFKENKELTNLLKKEELTEEEISRREYLQQKSDEYYDNWYKEIESQFSDTDRGLCLFNVFNSSISYDDVFYGSYKGTEFVAIEGREDKVFHGTVIRIPLKKEFENTLLVLSKELYLISQNVIEELQKDLSPIKLQIFDNHDIWADSPDISGMLEDKFIQYVNSSNKEFSYMFKENYAYLIWPHREDFFKLGTLFNKIGNPKQYKNFEKDLRSMLDELEKFANGF